MLIKILLNLIFYYNNILSIFSNPRQKSRRRTHLTKAAKKAPLLLRRFTNNTGNDCINLLMMLTVDKNPINQRRYRRRPSYGK